jgi:Phage portal protein
MFGRRRRELSAAADMTPPPAGPLETQLAALADARSGAWVTTRSDALQLSVVMRARDVVCGVLAQLPFVRTRSDGVDVGAGWLERPDPNHTRGWFVSGVVDDLFFHGVAYCWVTVVDRDGRPLALEWMPYTTVVLDPDGFGLTYYRRGRDQAGATGVGARTTAISLSWAEIVVFESPLTAVLTARRPLSTAARLDMAADRFSNVEMPGGVLKQSGGDDLTASEALEQITSFEAARHFHTVAYVSTDLEYVQSSLDPDRLQLVESRSYQDAALARICNIPAFAVGVGVPNESMTYKTAFTARADLIDFGIAPYITCLEQTLSSDQVTARGTTVTMDLEPFLRTKALSTIAPQQAADVSAAPNDQTAPVGS